MLFTTSWVADIFLLAIFILFVNHCIREKIKKTFFIIDPLFFFWAGVFVIYIIEGISNHEQYVQWYGADTIEAAYAWIFIGLVMLHFGYGMQQGIKLTKKIPNLPSRISSSKILFISLTLCTAGVFGWSLQIQSAGGLAMWAATPRGGENWEELSPYVGQLSFLLTVGLSLLLIHVEMHQRSSLMRTIAWLMIALYFLFFFYLGSRSRIIAVFLVALMAWSLPRRRTPNLLFLIPASMALFLMVNFQEQYRGYFQNLSFNLHKIDLTEVPARILPKAITGEASLKVVSKGTEFSMTAAVITYVPDKIPFAYGGEFLQIITNFVPRSAWPEKPYPRSELWSEVHELAGTSEWWVTHIHKPFIAGPAPGYIASWYYNGGIIGLLVGGIVTGIFFRLLRGIYARSVNNESYLILYSVLAPLGFGEAVSHPFGWVYVLLLVLVPLVIILKFMGAPSKAPPTRHDGIGGVPSGGRNTG
jgi:hypothetical protein